LKIIIRVARYLLQLATVANEAMQRGAMARTAGWATGWLLRVSYKPVRSHFVPFCEQFFMYKPAWR
jgi:hypothetical protein